MIAWQWKTFTHIPFTRISILSFKVCLKAFSWLVVFCLTASVFHVHAESLEEDLDLLLDLSLEQLMTIEVTTASKRSQKLQSAPAVLSVFTAEDIAVWGARNLNDIISRLPGTLSLSLQTYAFNTSFRGDTFNSLGDRQLIMIDGHPIRSDKVLGNSRFVYESFPINSINRIEVIRGPGSVLYGTNAVSGVINIITKRPDSSKFAITGKTGSNAYQGLQASAEINSEQHQGGLYWQSADYDGSKITNRDIESDSEISYRPDANNHGVYSAYQFKDLRLAVYQTESERDSVNFGQQFNEVTEEIDLIKFMANYDHHFNDDWVWSNSASYAEQESGFGDLFGGIKHRSFSTELETRVLYQGDNHDVMVGSHGTRTSNSYKGDVSVIVPKNTIENHYHFVQWDYRFIDRWALGLGTQYNKEKGFDGAWLMRASLIHQYNERHGFKLLYSEAYRTPTPLEKDAQSIAVVSNPDLEEEKSSTWDLQWYHAYQDYQGAVTLFRTEYQDGIIRGEQNNNPIWLNDLNDHIWGIELEGEYQFDPKLRSIFSLTWQDNVPESYAPDTLFKAGLAYDAQSFWKSAFFYSYIPEYRTNNKQQAEIIDVIPEGPFHMATLNASVDLNALLPVLDQQKWLLEAYLHNLFDENDHAQVYNLSSNAFNVGSRELVVSLSVEL